jgi:hypothetical protein
MLNTAGVAAVSKPISPPDVSPIPRGEAIPPDDHIEMGEGELTIGGASRSGEIAQGEPITVGGGPRLAKPDPQGEAWEFVS